MYIFQVYSGMIRMRGSQNKRKVKPENSLKARIEKSMELVITF